jgi:hypothetical protein
LVLFGAQAITINKESEKSERDDVNQPLAFVYNNHQIRLLTQCGEMNASTREYNACAIFVEIVPDIDGTRTGKY